ncbi:hypothetical protein ECG_02370 [Echinococcus granulosus]|uniref:Immunoglobulin subtype domain-containing protein n=1 Tax=Echinococcus granulosus TaxID=6210 RepID=A0A068WSL9_ECHGR|nr:hypothetical protein ECG_02370 [Echinococcus granulosus]CDS23151.1 hypothetical protein EgrG_001091500 [Echinococcus granulosus]
MDSEHDYQSNVNSPTHNLSFPCSQDYLFLKGFNCYRFTLVLKRQPQKTITCHVYARTVYESRSFQPLLQQPGNPKRPFFSDTEFDEDELLDEESEEDLEILREIASLIKPPNITVSSIGCGDVVNVTCTVPEESVELYITSHSFDLERCNGSWADLPSNGLSLLNFSVDENMDTFIAKASIRQTGGGDYFVVCRYLEKYAFRHLQIPKCSTPDSSRYLALAQQIGVIVVCQLAITSLLALTLWCCCSWRCSRRKRHSTAAMIYHRNETPPTNFHNSYSYAAAIGFLIYTELSHSSKSGDSFLRKIEPLQHCSAEDYLEPREIRESHLHTPHLPRMLRPSRQRRYPRRLPVKAHECLLVPLSCLRRSVVYFRLLRQIKALLQYCARMPKSAKLLLLCQKHRAKALNQSRWHISRSFDYKVK